MSPGSRTSLSFWSRPASEGGNVVLDPLFCPSGPLVPGPARKECRPSEGPLPSLLPLPRPMNLWKETVYRDYKGDNDTRPFPIEPSTEEVWDSRV